MKAPPSGTKFADIKQGHTDAGAGAAAAAAPVGPAEPIALPVIVRRPSVSVSAAAVQDRPARRREHRPPFRGPCPPSACRTYAAARERGKQCRDAEL